MGTVRVATAGGDDDVGAVTSAAPDDGVPFRPRCRRREIACPKNGDLNIGFEAAGCNSGEFCWASTGVAWTGTDTASAGMMPRAGDDGVLSTRVIWNLLGRAVAGAGFDDDLLRIVCASTRTTLESKLLTQTCKYPRVYFCHTSREIRKK